MVRASLAACLVVPLGTLLLLGCGANSSPAPSAATLGGAATNSAMSPPVALDDSRYAAPPVAGPPPAAGPIADPVPLSMPAAGEPYIDAYAGGDAAAQFRRLAESDAPPHEGIGPSLGGDKYDYLAESDFLTVRDAPLSTFSIDVDTASYAKTRSYLLEHHRLPPPDAVRIEELLNYFDYDYAAPDDEHPFAVHIETSECPWQPQHRLVRFGLQGKRVDDERPVSNLVFLIDVSGSMNAANRLPLAQRALSLLVRQLDENDRVAIVVYAGAAGLVLPPTAGTEQPATLAAIENLRAGGSTNGGQGIHLAYQVAQEHFLKGGVNRVLLCTDGDFNVGTTSTGDLVRLAVEQANSGIYLTVLGFGMGNQNDAMLEQLSNKANGNYFFIDSQREAQKVLVEQMQGTLVTIARDVKIQVEFNPVEVAAYRLIGYENRRLADRDFNDDTKDAGDIGAGHSVTALYEIVPTGIESPLTQAGVDPLRYQGTGNGESAVRSRESGGESDADFTDAAKSGEMLTLKLRYQPPTGGASTLLTFPVTDSRERFGGASPDFQFAASVAAFGMLLRDSKYKGQASLAGVYETATAVRGDDKHGLRGEFLELVQAAQRLKGEPVGAAIPAVQPQVRRVVIGAPGVGQPRIATPAASQRSPLAVWLQTFRPEEVLTIGIGIGGLIVIFTLLAFGWLLVLRSRPVSFAAPSKAKRV
jgi:Ca-activated chloride channel homolog